jgi:hypothetical protein
MRGSEDQAVLAVLFKQSGWAMGSNVVAKSQDLRYDPGNILARHDDSSIASTLRHSGLMERLMQQLR